MKDRGEGGSLQIILLLIGAVIAIAIAFALFSLLFKSIKYAAAGVLAILALPAVLPGYLSHILTRAMGCSWLALALLIPVSALAGLVALDLGDGLHAAISACIGVAGLVAASTRWRLAQQKNLPWYPACRELATRLDRTYHFGFWSVLLGTALYLVSDLAPALDWLGLGYLAASFLTALYGAVSVGELCALNQRLQSALPGHHGTIVDTFSATLEQSFTCIGEDVASIVDQHIAFCTLRGDLVEIELADVRRAYARPLYKKAMDSLQACLDVPSGVERVVFEHLVKDHMGLPLDCGIELLVHHERLGQMHQFADGHRFVAHSWHDEVWSCSGCGLAELGNTDRKARFCSSLCEDTEKVCVGIRDQEPHSFINDAISRGFALVAGADAWVHNHRVVAAGGQGHGIAAERANTYLDRLRGRSATTLGDGNAKNGADRTVSGELLQSKYCRTAKRSVGAAFGPDGKYRYMHDGKPMILEVPPEQHAAAVKEMEERIRSGQVPGVTDPSKANDLVKPGTVSYDQAVAITKFGTVESLLFDAAEASVVAIGAASVSFCVSASIVYYRTGDASQAVRSAAIQAGKIGLLSGGAYIATQQLHRVEAVQTLLNGINVNWFPPTVRRVLADGMGVQSSNALKRALGGTVVSSVVSVTFATGPDLYRLVQREITLSQLKRTAATATASTVGAVAGSIVGGAMGSTVGPLGAFVGRIAGGTVGGAAAGAAVNWLFAEEKAREQTGANQRFRHHLAHLAMSFALTEEEIKLVVRNVLTVSGADLQQKTLASANEGRQYLNSVMKPVVVGVVKQRAPIALQESSKELLLAA